MGGCGQHLGTIFNESFHGFFLLEGPLELVHFKGTQVSFSQAWGMGLPSVSSNALELPYPWG